ncbi:MAG TPA: glycosyltransferase [Pyrinomonadaceae bacterium]|nr:glycosyltransferase [Pyrinomonadaceae bacterium]
MRILFVAMANSIHTARWIGQLSGQGWDVHLFPVEDMGVHTQLQGVKVHEFLTPPQSGLHPSVRVVGAWPFTRGSYLAKRIAGKLAPTRVERTRRLARTIRDLRPDIVHSLEIQHAGYLTHGARAHFAEGEFPTWAVTNWGSDIFMFGRLAEHVERIKAVMEACDYYHCECHRDVKLAREFGFKGEVLPVCPVAGGFDVERMRQLRQPGPTSGRRVVALKGYQNWAGRALVGLRALELCADVLEGYTVAVHLPSPEVRLAAELLGHATGIRFELERQGWTRDDVLRMHGRARVSIGLSISDAISTSLLEAMIMGAFPVQSDTGCGDEWVRNGENGLLVHPEAPEMVAAALRRALLDDALVDGAAEINARIATERLERTLIEPQAIAMYKKMAASPRRRDKAAAAVS